MYLFWLIIFIIFFIFIKVGFDIENIFWWIAVFLTLVSWIVFSDWIKNKFSTKKEKQNNKESNKEFYKEIWQKGVDGENAFKSWLREIDIPFLLIEQSKYTKYKDFKRPDFIINNNKLFAIEVKNKKINVDRSYKAYSLPISEIKGLRAFVDLMCMPIYFAFKNNEDWYFISLNKFLKYSYVKNNQFYVSLNRFTGIKNKFDFDNLMRIHD